MKDLDERIKSLNEKLDELIKSSDDSYTKQVEEIKDICSNGIKQKKQHNDLVSRCAVF